MLLHTEQPLRQPSVQLGADGTTIQTAGSAGQDQGGAARRVPQTLTGAGPAWGAGGPAERLRARLEERYGRADRQLGPACGQTSPVPDPGAVPRAVRDLPHLPPPRHPPCRLSLTGAAPSKDK